jgi:hypothetical protein
MFKDDFDNKKSITSIDLTSGINTLSCWTTLVEKETTQHVGEASQRYGKSS